MKDNATLDKLSDWAVENFQLPSLSSKLDKVIDAIKVEKMTVNNSTVNVVSILAATDVKVEVKDGYLVFTNTTNNTEVGNIKLDAPTTVKPVGDPIDVDGKNSRFIRLHLRLIQLLRFLMRSLIMLMVSCSLLRMYSARQALSGRM